MKDYQLQLLAKAASKKPKEDYSPPISSITTAPSIDILQEAKIPQAKEETVKAAMQFFDLGQEKEVREFDNTRNIFEEKMKKYRENILRLEKTPAMLSLITETHTDLEKLHFKLWEINAAFEEDLLEKYENAQAAILSDALLCNLMKNAIRDTLFKYTGKDKNDIIEKLHKNKLFKNIDDRDNLIFNDPLNKGMLLTAINTIFAENNAYAKALKAELQSKIGMTSVKETRSSRFSISSRNKLELDEKITQKAKEETIACFKENVLRKKGEGEAELNKIQQNARTQMVTLQDAWEKYNTASKEQVSSTSLPTASPEPIPPMEEKIKAASVVVSAPRNTDNQSTENTQNNLIPEKDIPTIQKEIFSTIKDILMGEGQISYWNKQRKVGGTKVEDEKKKMQMTPTGIGNAINKIKDYEKDPNISSLLTAISEEFEDRLTRTSFLSKKRIGRKDETQQIYMLMKEIKSNLTNAPKLRELLAKLEKTTAYINFKEQPTKHKGMNLKN